MKVSSIGEGINRLREVFRRSWKFAAEDVWDIELSSLTAMRGFGVRSLRIITLVFKGFKDDECSMHASSLTFSTLMAIVPILALGFSMARMVGDADRGKHWIQGQVSGWTQTFGSAPAVIHPSVSSGGTNVTVEAVDDSMQNELALRINSLVEKGFEKVENINFAKLGAAGLVLLIWMVISVLGRVEISFNRVWGISSGRSMWRRFTDYLSVLLILPVLIVAAASMPVMEMLTHYLPSNTADVVQRFVASGFFKNMMVLGMTSLAFAFLIMFMPNTVVKFKAGICGGFVTAVLFIIWLSLCAWMQIGVARSSKIYGSFAVVPILLTWVYISWQIVLFGAELAFAVQHYATYKMEQRSHLANLKARVILALAIITEASRSMEKDRPPLNISKYAIRNRIPVRFLNSVIDELVKAGYIAQLSDKEDRYALLKSPAHIKVSDIVKVVMNAGAGPDALGLSRVDAGIIKIAKSAVGGIDASLDGVTIEKLLIA